MKEDYKLKGTTQKLEIELEKETFDLLQKMEKHSKFTRSEILNTALKRFIATHKDFLPADLKRAG